MRPGMAEVAPRPGKGADRHSVVAWCARWGSGSCFIQPPVLRIPIFLPRSPNWRTLVLRSCDFKEHPAGALRRRDRPSGARR